MALQAIVDDSKEPPTFVLAGYVADANAWKDFSDAWHHLLCISDLPYLKGQELTKVLRWMQPEARDECLGEFGKCIKDFANGCVEFSVGYADFDWFKGHFDPRAPHFKPRFKNPYFMGFLLMFTQIVNIYRSQGLTDEMDCIFDCGIARRKMLEDGYAEMHAFFPSDIRQRINPQPLFRDDKKFLPLQAADLRAWYCHRCLVTGVPPGKIWGEMNQIALTRLHYNRADLADMIQIFRSPREEVAAKRAEIEAQWKKGKP